MVEAIRQGIWEEMERDPTVFVIGEDVGAYGGAFKVTDGLLDEFGRGRVIDTPISEGAIVGAACGAALMGMRPVAEFQFIDFISAGFDLLTNYAAKCRYRWGARHSRRVSWSMWLGRAFRPVSLAQRGGVFSQHRRAEDRRAVDRLRCEGFDQGGDSRSRSGACISSTRNFIGCRDCAKNYRQTITSSRSVKHARYARAATCRSLLSARWS